VVEAGLRWINADRTSRACHVGQVIGRCVNFGRLHPDELVWLSNAESYILDDEIIRDAIYEANWLVPSYCRPPAMVTRTESSTPKSGPRTWPSRQRSWSRTWPLRPKTGPRTCRLRSRLWPRSRPSRPRTGPRTWPSGQCHDQSVDLQGHGDNQGLDLQSQGQDQ